MSKIAYDPIKDRFARFIRSSRLLRRLFYLVLDLLFLRSWYVRREIRREGKNFEEQGEWNLLDAGSGFGQYDRFILSTFNNVQVKAVDVKEDYLEHCNNYFGRQIRDGRITFDKADLLDFTEQEKYEMVICIDVLEHITEDVEVMKRLRNALKPGGIFIAHSPSHLAEEDAGGDDDTFVDEHARTGYSREEITKKLKEAGFQPKKTEYSYGKFGHFAWVLSIKYPMLMLNRIGMPALLILLLYYPVTLPVSLLCNYLDLKTDNEKGTGVLVVGGRDIK